MHVHSIVCYSYSHVHVYMVAVTNLLWQDNVNLVVSSHPLARRQQQNIRRNISTAHNTENPDAAEII